MSTPTDPFVSQHERIRFPTDATLGNISEDEQEQFVPPQRLDPSRTLVLCFDGTGDQFDADNSNIVEFFGLLKKHDASEQQVYYQAGIGTYTIPQVATPFTAKIQKTIDEMIGWNLDAHVIGGYEFLMETYTSGDKICIFGFSRGAYIARALAGMIHKVGLLPRGNHQQVPFAYKMYSSANETGWVQSTAFKKTFSMNVPIEFLGVWDCVNSCGIIPRRLPFTASNSAVRVFRHALSLDERRAKFKANYWNRPTAKDEKMCSHPVHRHASRPCVSRHASHSNVGSAKPKSSKSSPTLREFERNFDNKVHETDVEEVWFAGCHCDIGGGSVENETPNSLARLSLRWMIREIFKADVGIIFHADGLRSVGIDPDMLYPAVLSRPPALSVTGQMIESIPTAKSAEVKKQAIKDAELVAAETTDDSPVIMTRTEEEEELRDALSPMYDQLSINKLWWLGEIFPFHQRYQKGDRTWVTGPVCNMGGPRIIPKQRVRGVKIHRSVKLRMEAKEKDGQNYIPKAKFGEEFVTWVD